MAVCGDRLCLCKRPALTPTLLFAFKHARSSSSLSLPRRALIHTQHTHNTHTYTGLHRERGVHENGAKANKIRTWRAQQPTTTPDEHERKGRLAAAAAAAAAVKEQS